MKKINRGLFSSMLSPVVSASLLAGFLAPMAVADIPAAEFQKAMEEYLKTDAGRKSLGDAYEAYQVSQQEEARKEMIEKMFKDRVELEAGTSPAKGPDKADITIFEFSDFECPYCSRGKESMDQVMKMYPGKIKLVFKNLPLDFHPNAKPAAVAALAAHKQGKFWEFHDALFDNQKDLGEAQYEAIAKKLGLDVDKFKADLKSPEIEAQLASDKAAGEKAGARGTPMFVVNGVKIPGALPPEQFGEIIDRLLKEKK